MRVRFIKSFRAYSKGAVIELGDGEANVLISRQIAAPEAQTRLIETADVVREVRTAEIKPQRRRRSKKDAIPQPFGSD